MPYLAHTERVRLALLDRIRSSEAKSPASGWIPVELQAGLRLKVKYIAINDAVIEHRSAVTGEDLGMISALLPRNCCIFEQLPSGDLKSFEGST